MATARTRRPVSAIRAGSTALAAAMLAGAVACGSPSSSRPSVMLSASAPDDAAALLRTEHGSLGTVLADSAGLTLYWFAIDTPTSSACDGECATQWPPVIGAPRPAGGVTLRGKLGTITRADGTKQATYDGHPLYTFAGDFAPGITDGNLLDQYGGVWHAVKIN